MAMVAVFRFLVGKEFVSSCVPLIIGRLQHRKRSTSFTNRQNLFNGINFVEEIFKMPQVRRNFAN
jgi:hypothetical protein